LTARGGSSNLKGKGDCEKLKSMTNLKKNQCAFCKKGHWKVDCLKLKGNKESKPDANVAQVKSSQVDNSNSDSSVISLTNTTTIVCYSDVSEWILDTNTTYHVFPKQDWFTSLRSEMVVWC